jgi:hypothetical protein
MASTTTGQLLVEMSSLTSGTAMDHFTHISWGGGGGGLSPVITYLDITDTSTQGATDGAIEITATGPGLPFEYSVGSGYQTGNTFTSLSATTYTIAVRNVSGYTATLGGIQISDPSGSNPPIISEIITVDTSSRIANDGSITIIATGGLAPYTYTLNNGAYQASNIFKNLPANVYTLYVKDANGVVSSLSGIRINQPPIITGSIGRKVDRERYLQVPRVVVRGVKLKGVDDPVPINEIKVKVTL